MSQEIVPANSPQANSAQYERLRAVSPSQPFVWKEVFDCPEAMPEEGWPYADARDEFLKSPFLLDADTLAQRWAGLETEVKIRALLSGPSIRYLREEVQQAIEEGRPVKPLTPDDLARTNARRRRETEEEIQRNRTLADVGEYQGIVYENGMPREVWKKLSPTERARHNADYRALVVTQRLLQGESTEIFETRNSSTVVTVEMQIQAALAENDPEYAAARVIAAQISTPLELPEGAPVPDSVETTEND